MENIAILTGGDSAEHDISLLSAKTVLENLDKNIYKGYIIYLNKKNFTLLINDENININKEDFSCIYKKKKIKFQKVFIALHGPPAENGEIQNYFENLKIKYTACTAETSALTFNKYQCNNKLKKLGFICAQSLIHKQENPVKLNDIINNIGIPCFIKPNESGSSYGITKVTESKNISAAINIALKHSNEVIIEEYIKGKELSCGVFFDGKIIQTLPITEIQSENDFFDYEAKYEGKSQEITPAEIDEELATDIKEISTNVYKKMNLRGICRIDFIVMNKQAYIIEINTIPGLSKESIVPQQLAAANIKLADFFTICLANVNN